MIKSLERDPDAIHTAWCDDFRALSDQIHRIHVRSQVFEPIDQAIVEQQKPGSALVVEQVLRPMYAEAQATAVRRLVDKRKPQRSLWRLVDDMARNAEVLSRRRYVAHYRRPDDEHFLELGSADFDGIAGEGAKHIPKRVLVDLRDELEESGRVVKAYVDERIAHSHPNPTTFLTFGGLKTAIHAVSRAYQRVGVFLNATHYEYVPVLQENWRGVFAEPLFPTSDRY